MILAIGILLALMFVGFLIIIHVVGFIFGFLAPFIGCAALTFAAVKLIHIFPRYRVDSVLKKTIIYSGIAIFLLLMCCFFFATLPSILGIGVGIIAGLFHFKK